uniref:Uncharacterized protein n=1 Tax=Megaviridae environmental sample TaxID=1737588 RepID=A0A5J6VK17_9VIRU|nr:MAG: hypothetical protein [Megaviridae environmental sample]
MDNRVDNRARLNNIIQWALSNDYNACLCCGEDMGEMNPRQLCGGVYCHNMTTEEPVDDNWVERQEEYFRTTPKYSER